MSLNIRECLTLIAQVEMLSHGSTQAFNASGGHSAEKANPLPPGESNPPHLWLRAELDKAMTQSQVDRVAQKARTVLRKARYAPDRELVYGTLEWRRKVGTDARSAKVVAEVYGISERHVCRLRAECREAA